MEPTGMQKADPAESPAGAITWKVMNFSPTEADGRGDRTRADT